MTRTERDGYSYTLECSGGDFTAAAPASAPHRQAPPIRYPNLAIDATMQVHEIN